MSTPLLAAPGDVLAVVTGPPWVALAIRFAAMLEGKSTPANHVIGVTHQDAQGRWIGLQGQPGGVGLVDCTPYLADPRTRSNHSQPKPDDTGQLDTLLASAAKTIGVGYDWVGIGEDAALALHAADLAAAINRLYAWGPPGGTFPGEVVCSSLWAELYDQPAIGYAHPDLGTERVCTPADWWIWNDRHLWEQDTGHTKQPHGGTA